MLQLCEVSQLSFFLLFLKRKRTSMKEVNEEELYSVEYLEFYNLDPGPVDEEFFEVFRFYDGAPFTGKAIADNTIYTGERYYIDGLPHGLCSGTYRNGKKFYEGWYNHGRKVGEHSTWNENGVLTEQVNYSIVPLVERRFDENGRLYYEHFITDEAENTYYKTGQLLSARKSRLLEVYTPEGEVAYTRRYNDYKDDAAVFEQDGQYSYVYNNGVMKKNITALAGEHTLRDDLVYWIYKLEEQDRDSAAEVLNIFIGHDDLFIKSEAISIAAQSGYKECLPAILKELKNHAVPGNERDHRGLICNTNDTPVSETAREAIGAITGAN